MSTNQTFEWENSILGGHSAYPGHPIVVACMIMDRYQNFEHASRVEEGEQFTNASTDSFIPGAGDAVSTALAVLKLAQKEGIAAAYKLAERYWEGYNQQSPKNAPDVALGLKQFEAVKDRFAEHLAVWGTPSAPVSAFRLADEPPEPRKARPQLNLR